MSRIAVLGEAGSGKSTLIRGLSQQGITTLDEVARQIITANIPTNEQCLPWNDLEKFQYFVFKQQYQNEEISKSFVGDRGLMDGIAYLIIAGAPIPSYLEKYARKRYDEIFWVERLDFYKPDSERKETREEAALQTEIMLDVYKTFGYRPKIFPNTSITQRVEQAKKIMRIDEGKNPARFV